MLEKEIESCVGHIKLLFLIEAFWGYSVGRDKQIISSASKTIFDDFLLDAGCYYCLVNSITGSLRFA